MRRVSEGRGSGTDESGYRATPSRRRLLKLAAGSSLAFGFAGCIQEDGNGGDADGSGDDDGSSLDGETVQMIALSPLSGPFSPLGPGQRNAAQLAADVVSESDEFDFEIDLETADTETDPSTARLSAEQALEEGTSFICGGINSSVALSLADLAENSEVVYTTGGAGMQLTEGECNAYTFRNETNAAQQATAVARWIVGQEPDSVWIHTADYAYGNSAMEQIETRLDEAGIEIAGRTVPDQGTDDMGPFISQILDADVDILAIPLTGGDLINFLRQSQERNLKDQTDIIGTANFSRVIRGGAGTDAVSGTYTAALYDSGLEVSDNQDFVEAYADEYDGEPDHFARVGYDAVRVTALGIQEAGSSDSVDVAETLSGMSIQTLISDETEYRECDHQSPNPIWPSEVVATEDGEGTELDVIEELSPEETTPDCTGVCEK